MSGAAPQTVVSNFGTEKHDERRHVGFLQRLQACDRLKETLQAERGCYIKMKHTFWQVRHFADPDHRMCLHLM